MRCTRIAKRQPAQGSCTSFSSSVASLSVDAVKKKFKRCLYKAGSFMITMHRKAAALLALNDAALCANSNMRATTTKTMALTHGQFLHSSGGSMAEIAWGKRTTSRTQRNYRSQDSRSQYYHRKACSIPCHRYAPYAHHSNSRDLT